MSLFFFFLGGGGVLLQLTNKKKITFFYLFKQNENTIYVKYNVIFCTYAHITNQA